MNSVPNQSRAATTEILRDDHRPIALAFLLFWTLGTLILLGFLTLYLTHNHAGIHWDLHQFNDLLPPDPRTWGITA